MKLCHDSLAVANPAIEKDFDREPREIRERGFEIGSCISRGSRLKI
jgi:hypothetical protein